MLIPSETARSTVEHELPPLAAYVKRHHWSVEWLRDAQRLEFRGLHRVAEKPVTIIAAVDEYPAIPPAWTVNVENGQFPIAGAVLGKSSIFHSNRVICAPFNRLAYGVHGGPHPDWILTGWRDVRGNVSGRTLSEMFASILVHLRYSPGLN